MRVLGIVNVLTTYIVEADCGPEFEPTNAIRDAFFAGKKRFDNETITAAALTTLVSPPSPQEIAEIAGRKRQQKK